MAANKEQNGCARCERLEERLAELEAELAKAKKNSSNSSKPPSSDIVNPGPKQGSTKRKNRKRKQGGQPGHARHERTPFQPDEIDVTWIHYYTGCPCCGGQLIDTDEPEKVMQHIELDVLPIRVEEHRRSTQRCTQCDRLHCPPWPEDLKKAGLVGPRLTALIGYLKSACHMSFGSIRKYLRDVVGVKISRGQLRKLVAKVADSVLDPYEQLLAMLPHEDRVNVDETGHKENGERLWTWCFRASLYTVFKISPSRGSQVLEEVLGQEFNGVLGCDYFSAYRKYMKDFNVVVQFCLAHFIRDVKFLADHPKKKNRQHGERLLELLRKLFRTIHRRDEYASEASFRKVLNAIRNDLVYTAIMESPGTREADNLGDRFVNHFESFFTFITTPGVEPTNNLAEQAIRFVAIHRRLTQGTRGEAGRNWCERIWTVITTCEQQGRSIFEYLCGAVTNYFHSRPAPSLIPAPDTS
ncbi:MAG: IS66 family transposase [Planctomycetales bacterium]|nr:IS66 family transposase [Planctomycetales bacterium]